MKNKIRNISSMFVYVLIIAIFISPIAFLLKASFMDQMEISFLFSMESTFVDWIQLLPRYPTLAVYFDLLIKSPEYYVLFWNSVKLSVLILSGQLIIGALTAWGLARYKFYGNSFLFLAYVIIMVLPFQSTMLAQYLTLDKLSLLNSHSGLIWLSVFSALPVFFLYQSFRAIDEEILDAARLDGAGEVKLLLYIGVPMGRTGIYTVLVLGFLECWNMLEQPLMFVSTKSLWPVSLYLSNVEFDSCGNIFAAAILSMIPAYLIFSIGQSYLESGISTMGKK